MLLEPHQYEYQAIRNRRTKPSALAFDWVNNFAIATVENASVELQLEGNTLDELSMYTLIKQELNKGNNEIIFSVS